MRFIKLKYIFRPIAILLAIMLVFTGMPYSYAQATVSSHLSLLNPTPAFNPLILKGVIVDPANPLQFKFVVGQGETHLTERQLREEVDIMLKYFLAALAMPEEDIWVNLSPYESDRIIPDKLAQTDMGKTLLAQDYLLKQLAASLTYPETKQGKLYWNEINNPVIASATKQSQSKIATPRSSSVRNDAVDSFNKVWIVPDSAVVYQNKGRAYLGECHLKVMMESDYLAMNKNGVGAIHESPSTNAFKQYILPLIEKEVNTGKTFAALRQVFNAIVLAIWFKQTLKQTLLGQAYANKQKVNGIDAVPLSEKEKIYGQYLKAFQQGAYDYVKSERVGANGRSPMMGKITHRRYFSGGVAIPDGFAEHGMQLKPAEAAQPTGTDLVVNATGGEGGDKLFEAVNAILVKVSDSEIPLSELNKLVREVLGKLPASPGATTMGYLNLLATIFSGSAQAIRDKCAITEYLAGLKPNYDLFLWKVTNILKVAQAAGNGEALAALHKLSKRANEKPDSPDAINPGVAGLGLLMTLSLRAADSAGRLELADLYALLEEKGIRFKGMPFSPAVESSLIDSISDDHDLADPVVELATHDVTTELEEVTDTSPEGTAGSEKALTALSPMPIEVPGKKDERHSKLTALLRERGLDPFMGENADFLEKVSGNPRLFRLFMQSVQDPLIPLDAENFEALQEFLVKLSGVTARNAAAYGIMAVGSGSIVAIADGVMQVGHLQGSSFPYILSALLLGGNAVAHSFLPPGVRRTIKKLEELFALVREGKVHPLAADWVTINSAIGNNFSTNRIDYKNLAAYVKFARKFLPATLSVDDFYRAVRHIASRYGLQKRLRSIAEAMATEQLVAAGKTLRGGPSGKALAPIPADGSTDGEDAAGGVDFRKSFNLKFMGQADNLKNISLDKPFPFKSFCFYIIGIEKDVDIKRLLTTTPAAQ